jgi:hypothetical protein
LTGGVVVPPPPPPSLSLPVAVAVLPDFVTCVKGVPMLVGGGTTTCGRPGTEIVIVGSPGTDAGGGVGLLISNPGGKNETASIKPSG